MVINLFIRLYLEQNEKIIEIQIRTKSMDRLAEVGIAAHWIYKEQGHRNQTYC